MTDLALFPALQPDLPGYVHGIINTTPPTVQCAGCGATRSGATWAEAVLFSNILFSTRTPDERRLCESCRVEAGWTE